jgi:hypothetical protein
MVLKFEFGKIKVANGLQIASRVLYSTYNVLELAHQKKNAFCCFLLLLMLEQKYEPNMKEHSNIHRKIMSTRAIYERFIKLSP